MVAYDYLLVELNFGAAFLCNLNHFIHALARFFLCIGVVCVNIIHLRTKRRTVCNYQNLLGFNWEDLLFDVIFACRRDTDNFVFLADFCKQLMVSPRRCESLVIIVPSVCSQNKIQNARWLLIKKTRPV